jgi:tetratricopeptide (TPR) repeat protein
MLNADRNWMADGLVVLTLVTVCFGLGLFKEVDVDLGFHLRTGEHVLTTGTIPQKDIFSYTSTHKEWPLHYWIPDVGLYWIYARWGMEGLILAKCAVITLIFLVMYVGMRRVGVAWFLALLLVLWVAIMARPRFSIRPLLGSQLFLSILVAWWMAARAGRGVSLRYLPLLFIVWANVHAGMVFGVILVITVAGIEILKRILGRIRDLDLRGFTPALLRSFVLWSAIGIAAAAFIVWVMNPLSLKGLLLPFQFYRSDFFMSVIEEYGPISLPRDSLFAILGVVAVAGFVLNRRRVDWTEIALLGVFGYLAATSVRIVIVFGIVMAPIIGRNFQAALGTRLDSLEARLSGWRSPVAAIAVCGLVLFGTYGFVKRDRAFREGFGFDERTFPEKAFQYIERHRPAGEIFNSDMWGGPMILRLYPGYRVFVDGRQEVYEEDFWRQVYFRILAGGEGWEETLSRYGVNVALLRHVGGDYGHRISSLMWDSPDWALVYWDDLVSIYVRAEERNRSMLADAYRVVDPDAFDMTALRATERLEAARTELDRKVDEDPDSWRGRLYLGQVLLDQGDPERARVQFREILNRGLMEDPSAARSGLGDAMFALGAPDSALVWYRRALRDRGDDGLLLLKEIAALGALDRVDDARSAIGRLKDGDDRIDGTKVLGQALLDAGHLASAAEFLESATRRDPRRSYLFYTLGMVYEGLDRTRDAEGAYRSALEWTSDFPEALNNLAWLLAMEGDRLTEAGALAQQALRLLPGDPGVLDTLGWIQYLMGDGAAAKTLEDAVSALGASPGPGTEVIFYHLGRARLAAGDRPGAAQAFRKALEINPDHSESRAALEAME